MMQPAPEDCSSILIVGAGGHGREVASYLRVLEHACAPVRLAGFVDEQVEGKVADAPVVSTVAKLGEFLATQPRATYRYITAVGHNTVRESLVERLATLDLGPWTLCHPAVICGPGVEIGEGTCIAPGAILTTAVRIGRHCIVNVGTSVSHDSVVGDFCNLNPGVRICGAVTIGAGCFIGAGATVINGISIGAGTIIGAGTVVVHDIPAHVTAVGVPARVIKHHG